MRGKWSCFFALTLALATATSANAVNVIDKENVKLDLGAYAQWLGVAENVPDNFRDETRAYLFLKQARIRIDGEFHKTKFDIMLATGGEDITPNTNAALGLLDFSFDVPLTEATHVKVGQFLVPYGRERLTDDSTLSFGDRSIENLGFAWNRDVGVALSHERGNLVGTFAVMTGGGRDVPQRYLPETLGIPLLVARFGLNDGIDEDIYHVSGRHAAPDRAKKAFYVNALFLEDSEIGHSTVVNVRATDKNLLVNSNYNPFIARRPFSLATIWQAGVDGVYRAPFAGGAINVEGQVDYSHFDNEYGDLSLRGGRVQVGYSRGKLDANLRLAALWLDDQMAYVNAGVRTPILDGDDSPLLEITPSLTYRFREGVVVVADLPYQPDMLVFEETGIGSYVLSAQPDQVTVTKPSTGRIFRDDIIGARLMIQLGF
jgi:hypothetical protein